MCEDPVSAVDVKEYFFCPRTLYFRYALGLPERVTGSMEEGGEVHGAIRRREEDRLSFLRKRRLRVERKFQGVLLSSERLCLVGRLDAFLVLEGGEYVPVEYKVASFPGRIPRNHYYQLVAYALLLEDRFGVFVRRGLVYYSLDERLVEAHFTREAKEFLLRRVLPTIVRIREGFLPERRVPLERCKSCGYYEFCRGV